MPTAAPTVVPIDPLADDRWDAFVARHPDATVYQLSAWSRILSDAYRFRPRHLALERDGELLGVLPLMYKRGPISGRRLRSLPVVQTGGPLGVDLDASARLVAAALEMARADDALLVVATRTPEIAERVEGIQSRVGQPTWILAVPPPEELEAWERARSKNLRRSIAKARRAGLTVRLANDRAALRAFYRMYLGTMQGHRSLPRTHRQFEGQRRWLGAEGRLALFLVEEDAGALLAGGMFHVFNDTAELVYNASDPDRLDLRPNHALYRHVVGWCSERGIGRFDFGGGWEDTALADFKRQWGAEAVAEYTYVASDAPEQVDVGTAMTGRATGSGLGTIVRRVWERAPLEATEAVASVAYRWL